jgi:hypothetical protein
VGRFDINGSNQLVMRISDEENEPGPALPSLMSPGEEMHCVGSGIGVAMQPVLKEPLINQGLVACCNQGLDILICHRNTLIHRL